MAAEREALKAVLRRLETQDGRSWSLARWDRHILDWEEAFAKSEEEWRARERADLDGYRWYRDDAPEVLPTVEDDPATWVSEFPRGCIEIARWLFDARQAQERAEADSFARYSDEVARTHPHLFRPVVEES
jgi:hypothetical protein